MLTNPIVAPGAQIVLTGSTWATAFVGLLAALVVALMVSRRRTAAGLAVLSLTVIVAVTIVPLGGWAAFGFETGALRSVITNVQPHHSALRGWLRNSDGPANVLLFVPAGLFVAWWSRRPLASVAALALLSFAIECWQAILTTRVGSFDDVVANSLGAAVGAAIAAVGLVLHRATVGRRPQRNGSPSSPQRATIPF